MSTTPVAPAPGPLEQSLAARAGAASQTAVEKGEVVAQTVLTDAQKGAVAAQQGVDGAAATIENMAAKGQAALDHFKESSAAGVVGSRVQTAIDWLTAMVEEAKGFLFTHKAANNIPQTASTSPTAPSATSSMPAPVAVPTDVPKV